MFESVARFEMIAVSSVACTVIVVPSKWHCVPGCVSFWLRIASMGSCALDDFVEDVGASVPELELQPAAKARRRVPSEARKVRLLNFLVNVVLGICEGPPSLVGQLHCTAS